MVPMAALTGAPPGARRAFFQGDAHGMRFVTAHSPSAGGRAGVRLVELRARDAGSGAELVLREAPCPTAVVLGELLGDASWAVRPETEDAWPGGHLRMVASRPLATWKFEYLSEPAGPRQRREWVARWEDRGTIPRAVRIEWVEERPAGGAGRKRTVTGAVIGATRASGEIGR